MPRAFTDADRAPLTGTVSIIRGGRSEAVCVEGFVLDEHLTTSRQCRRWFYRKDDQLLEFFRDKRASDGSYKSTWTLVASDAAVGAGARKPRGADPASTRALVVAPTRALVPHAAQMRIRILRP
jgi:hypothetical protein